MKWTLTIILSTWLCCKTFNVSAQNIIVDDSYTAKKLVENVLINSSCVSVTNISVKGDLIPVGQNSYGYFTKGSSNFPFTEGIVLSSGAAKNAMGPYVFYGGDLNDSSWVGDADINQAMGMNSINATVLEFDITPLTNFISFDYILASNEYKEGEKYPCEYSEGLAFLIKEVGSSNPYQNLAVIPGTTTTVSTKNIHPKITALGGCTAINENYYNGNNTSTSPINYAGQTVVMNANTTVIPGTTYHIKLVIADDQYEFYDSAVFIKAGSFTSKINLGPDRLLPTNPICFGESFLIDTKLPTSNTYKWYKNGIEITGETNPSYNATTTGTYSVEVFFTPTCSATASIKVDFTPEIILKDTSLAQCDPDGDGISPFDLTTVDNIIRNNDTNLSQVVYYESLTDAKGKINAILNPKTYINKLSNPILFARVTNSYMCEKIAQLNLNIVNNYITPQNPIITCDDDAIQDGLYQFDLAAQVSPQLLTGLPNGLLVNYYLTENDAVVQKNSLATIFKNNIPYQQIIYARIINGPNCFGITPITLIINTFDPTNFQDETVSICDGSSALLTIDSIYSSYLWSTGEVTNSITVTNEGNYSVIITGANGCTKTKNFKVLSSEIATITDAEVYDFAGIDNYVSLQFTGKGNYEFAIDGFNYQDEPLFSGVAPGIYHATARDKNGCGISDPFTVYVIDYPRFFTPNGDGYNDVWQIKNLNILPKAVILIYNRYGKFLKELTNDNQSWNGTYVGKELPADDYWFQIKFPEKREIKGHFSLKR